MYYDFHTFSIPYGGRVYLITGATGTIGRPLLAELHGQAVRAVTRDPSRLPGAVAEPDVTGVTALFLHPRAVGLGATDLLARAKAAGVRRVVVLSATNVDDPLDDQPSRFNGDRNKEVEAAAIGSGLEWVRLRAGYFAINTVWSWGPQIRVGDVVRAPFPHMAEAPVDPRDLAAVAARALVDDDLVGRKLVLTGPESLTHEQLVATIGRMLGRELRYSEVPALAAAAGMVAHGQRPEFVAALMARYERENGRPAHVSGDVEKVLGRPARTFADWVADHAEYFR
jgi:uncharacterized protein YbjT (DUF2867 family)